jgi:hypothetical protein
MPRPPPVMRATCPARSTALGSERFVIVLLSQAREKTYGEIIIPVLRAEMMISPN